MFLKKLSDFIVKFKYIFLSIFIVLLIMSIIGTIFLVKDEKKINSDMMSYFTEDFDTSKGFEFLKDNFNIRGDVMLVVRGVEDDEELRNSINKIRTEYEGVTQVVWVEDVNTLVDMKQKLEETDFSGLDVMENPAIKQLMEDEDIQKIRPDIKNYVQLMSLDEVEINADALNKYLKRDLEDGTFDYIITMMIEYSPSTKEATDLLDSIKEEVVSTTYNINGVDKSRNIASAGMTQTSESVMTETLKELPDFLIYAVFAVIIILLLTSKSFLEPIILVTSLGVSIIISMGVNYLYPSISIISFATCSVLQLAITM
ncbi:MAG: MMPL family transporter, partial [Clostridia bacterium]